eukprot:1685718-Rhodomonas_salina.1
MRPSAPIGPGAPGGPVSRFELLRVWKGAEERKETDLGGRCRWGQGDPQDPEVRPVPDRPSAPAGHAASRRCPSSRPCPATSQSHA